MRIGRFFSLGRGRVGQYLSPRVLVVRTPFQRVKSGFWNEFCCFGFENFSQAQKFMRSLAHIGLNFRLQQSRVIAGYPYEVVLAGHADLAQTLAYWDRQQPSGSVLARRTVAVAKQPKSQSDKQHSAIAA